MNNKQKLKQFTARFTIDTLNLIEKISKEKNESKASIVEELVIKGLSPQNNSVILFTKLNNLITANIKQNQEELNLLNNINDNVNRLLLKLEYNNQLTARILLSQKFPRKLFYKLGVHVPTNEEDIERLYKHIVK